VILKRPQKLVLVQFEDTPKAFANFSPGLELATTLGQTREKNSTLKALGQLALANAFSVRSILSLNPGLELATTLGQTSEKNTTLKALASSR
jgi:hypothetical protein